jgi:surfeit locus 1 family protein
MRGGGVAGLTAITACILALLVGLGVWQLQRLQWKEGLIARIEARSTAPPITLKKAVSVARQGNDIEYSRVGVEGRFHYDKERYLYALADGTAGWDVITPLETADGDIVLVDRGFVPDALRDPSSRKLGQLEEVVSVTGLLRSPEMQGIFTPDNESAHNRWFWRDLSGMARSMFPDGTTEVAPFFLAAERSNVPGGWPEGGQTRIELPNDHLQYALTWFALALCIVVLYAVYLRNWFRESRSVAGKPPGR